MNYGISVLYRAIPLMMALVCFAYGIFIGAFSDNPNSFVASHVIFSLGMICIALFATAATIIRQIIKTYGKRAQYNLTTLGYLSAIVTIIYALGLLDGATEASHIVTGHVVCGVGLITACVATVATSSVKFTFIPINSDKQDHNVADGSYYLSHERVLESIAIVISAIAWIWAFALLKRAPNDVTYFVASHVMIGLACICTSLIALISTIVRQVRNVFTKWERRYWPLHVLFFGTVSFVWGIIVILLNEPGVQEATGYIMIGLGLVCYSISSKVILLAKSWKHLFKLSSKIPMIPIFTALACLFLAAFLFEKGTVYQYYFIPARVLCGLGAVCFTLFSIVSILESGTSKK